MPLFETLLGPISRILDKAIPDPQARERAKLELLAMSGSQEIRMLEASLSAIVAEASSADPWASRARPAFLYVIYAMILWAIPVGVIAAFSSRSATAITAGMTGYLQGLPEPLYALFGTGYLGYSAMRQWGKIKGADR